jgi:hypothetical protein
MHGVSPAPPRPLRRVGPARVCSGLPNLLRSLSPVGWSPRHAGLCGMAHTFACIAGQIGVGQVEQPSHANAQPSALSFAHKRPCSRVRSPTVAAAGPTARC